MLAQAAAKGGGDPGAIVQAVLDAVAAHAAGAPPSDDLTCVAFRYKAPPDR